MSEITNPIMLDDTGQDLVTEAQNIVTKLQALINAVKPTAADIPLAAISGMTADDVQEGVAELKSNLMDNTITVPTLPSGQSSLSITDGGYTQIGKIVIVNVRISVTTAINSGTAILSGFPKPKNRNNSVDVIGFGGINQNIGACYIDLNGNLIPYFDLSTGTKLFSVTYICQ